MKPIIKSIETRAYGRRFRSRLEARWAVFFTSLGLRWEYEPEGFDLQGILYLPDFRVWTPQGRPAWFEVKPTDIKADEKFKRFVSALQVTTWPVDSTEEPRAMLLSGDPCQFMHDKVICPRCGIPLDRQWQDLCASHPFFYCWYCDCETPSGGGHPVETDGVQGLHYLPNKGNLALVSSELQRLIKITNSAITAALSARFEHGDSPSF